MKKQVNGLTPASRGGRGKLLKVEEAAQALSLSPKTLRQWIGNRRIGVTRIGGAVRIPASEVSRLIEDGFVPAKRVS